MADNERPVSSSSSSSSSSSVAAKFSNDQLIQLINKLKNKLAAAETNYNDVVSKLSSMTAERDVLTSQVVRLSSSDGVGGNAGTNMSTNMNMDMNTAASANASANEERWKQEKAKMELAQKEEKEKLIRAVKVKLEKQKDEYEAKIKVIADENAALKTELETVKQSSPSSTSTDKQQKKDNEIEPEKVDSRSVILGLQTSVNERDDKIKEIQEENNKHIQETNALKERLQELQQQQQEQFDSRILHLQEETKKHLQEQQALTSKISELQASLEKERSSVQSLESRLNAVSAERASFRDRVKDKMAIITSDKKELERRLKVAEDDRLRLETETAEAVKAAAAKRAEAEAELEAAARRKQAALNELEELASWRVRINEDAATVSELVRVLEKKLAGLTAAVDSVSSS